MLAWHAAACVIVEIRVTVVVVVVINIMVAVVVSIDVGLRAWRGTTIANRGLVVLVKLYLLEELIEKVVEKFVRWF